MNKLFFSVLLVILSFIAFPLPALAVSPNSQAVQRVPAWNLLGNYTIDFDCGDCVPHYIEITSYNVYTGVFGGSGYYVSNPTFSWNVSGHVSGDQVHMTIVYTGENPGYEVYFSGMLAPNGSMSGFASDSAGQQFNGFTIAGLATAYTTHGDFVSAQEDKQMAAHADFGKPVN